MDTRTCSICGKDKPLTREHYRWREQDGKGYFTGECKECITKAKKVSRLKAKAKRKAALDKIEAAGVDIFTAATVNGGSNIPHTAELVERVFQYFGGVGGFGAVLVKQYWDSPPGGSARNRLLETMCRLVTKNVDSGGAKKPLQLWSDADLEAELQQRLVEAVSSFKGITIDATQEEARRIEAQAAPQGKAPRSAAAGRDDAVSEGVDQGTPERTAGAETGVAAAVPPEPESGGDPRLHGE
jgi:hypothetical protein